MEEIFYTNDGTKFISVISSYYNNGTPSIWIGKEPSYNLDVSGSENFSGSIGRSTYINAVGAGQSEFANKSLPQGTYFSWNSSNGTGEKKFINSRGLGSGGFNFIDISSGVKNSNNILMKIQG